MVAPSRTDQQVEALKLQYVALTQALRLATNRYRAGYSPYLDQLDARRGLLNAELGFIQARVARLSAYVDLYRALGGGWRTGGIAADSGHRRWRRRRSGATSFAQLIRFHASSDRLMSLHCRFASCVTLQSRA
jgi:hypothetical protein